MIKRGILREKILPTGIPIDVKYARRMPTNKARKKLGLDNGPFTILMSAGGMGFSGMVATAQGLDQLEDIQMVAVCGTNARLSARMKELKLRSEIKVLEFVHNMDEYMDACDVFITKPGGLSTSEAIAKKKPLLLTKPMPGVENMNLAFLVNHSLAVHANKYQPESEVIMQLRANGQKLDEMKVAQTRWGKKDSAIALGEFLERMV
jgi:processive 1,2-diacylglycerol beta-glucosyltransferase